MTKPKIRAANTASKQLILAAESSTFSDGKASGVAYTGGSFTQDWSGSPVYLDLDTLTIAAQIPIMYNHIYSPEFRLGVARVTNEGHQLSFTGELDAEKPLAAGIIKEGKKTPWQVSIGADAGDTEEIFAGNTAVVNGRTVTGPALICHNRVLREISTVALGANLNTHMEIAAKYTKAGQDVPQTQENVMNEELKRYILAKYKLGEVDEKAILAHLTSVKSSIKAEETELRKLDTPAPTEYGKTQVQASANVDIDALVQAALAKKNTENMQRVASIQAAFGSDFPELKAQAVTENWSVADSNTALLKAMREARPVMPSFSIAGSNTTAGETIKAATMLTAGIRPETVIASTSEASVDLAQKRFRSGCGPKRLILEAALLNGFTGHVIDGSNWHEATDMAIHAQFSNVSLTGILADVYNKRMLEGFTHVDQAWRKIAKRTPVNDFKQINSYRLNMSGGFEKVGPDGELKHASLSDESYSNQAETFGKIIGLTRKNIIDDDMGALNSVPFGFGRLAGNSFNKWFWTEFLDNAAFFSSANNNIKTSATALSVTGIDEAKALFYAITAADGDETGIEPAILLTSRGLETLATQLYKDTQLGVVGVGSAKAVAPVSNPHAGKFEPVATNYLSNSKISGSSPTAYYLLADPLDCPAIEAVFLDGRETPFVESSAAQFNTLGIQYRPYLDWGVKKQDPKAGVKMSV